MFLHVLDDLWDFHTKSLFLVFNFWEAENLLFLVFNVSGPSGTQIGKGKIAQLVFHRENDRGKKIEVRRGTRPKRGGPTRRRNLAAWDPLSGASGTSSLGAF